MNRYLALTVMLLAAFSSVAHADQLAWISRADAERVVAGIQKDIVTTTSQGKRYYMASYCSQCDRSPVEVWEVRKVITVAIPDTEYFQVNVFGRPVLRSVQAIRKGEYREPVEYRAVAEDEAEWFVRGVDLAYVYVPSVDGALPCVGMAYGLECEVLVQRIRIPREAFEKIEPKEDDDKADDDEGDSTVVAGCGLENTCIPTFRTAWRATHGSRSWTFSSRIGPSWSNERAM